MEDSQLQKLAMGWDTKTHIEKPIYQQVIIATHEIQKLNSKMRARFFPPLIVGALGFIALLVSNFLEIDIAEYFGGIVAFSAFVFLWTLVTISALLSVIAMLRRTLMRSIMGSACMLSSVSMIRASDIAAEAGRSEATEADIKAALVESMSMSADIAESIDVSEGVAMFEPNTQKAIDIATHKLGADK